MRRGALRTAVAFAVLAAAAGCSSLDNLNPFGGSSSKDVAVDPNLVPANFKAEIIATIPKVYYDPSGIHDAYYSDPVIRPDTGVTVYQSCVRLNPRGPDGQYLGDREYIAYYYGGHLSQFFRATDDRCAKAAYRPFPEIERLCAPNVKNKKVCP
ncbi:MAG: hypothetical protein OJF62_001709 [Pseudolabrys sp.]|jgi:hypothetical protein|nr:hypothetical protein [Pseudolabrys sp.]